MAGDSSEGGKLEGGGGVEKTALPWGTKERSRIFPSMVESEAGTVTTPRFPNSPQSFPPAGDPSPHSPALHPNL